MRKKIINLFYFKYFYILLNYLFKNISKKIIGEIFYIQVLNNQNIFLI